MKRSVLLSVLFGAMPLLSMAQDDLYFTPSKADQSAYQQSKVEEDRPVIIAVLVSLMTNTIVVASIIIRK